MDSAENNQSVRPQAPAPAAAPAGPAVQAPATIQAQPVLVPPTQSANATTLAPNPRPTATQATSALVGPAIPSSVKVYRQRIHEKNSTLKHTPIAPRNTVILERDNPGLCRKPFKKSKAEPEKLNITLVDTKFNIHKRFFPDKDSMDWDDAEMIAAANKWRNQVLRRVFKKDSTFKGRTVRAKWGRRETAALKNLVESKVKEVGGRKLTGIEWREVQDKHNARFKGTKIFKGERLLNGELAKTEETIEQRTVVAIKALFERRAELKQFMSDLVDEIVDSYDAFGVERGVFIKGEDEDEDMEDKDEDEDETENEESPSKNREGEHGGIIDPRLEDPSDDEEDGQRPASNPVGGVFVSVF